VKQNGEHGSPWGAASQDAKSTARTAHNIGIEIHGGRAIVLIPAGSRTPVARAMTFTTVADGQRAVEVRVVRCAPASGSRQPADSASPYSADSASRHPTDSIRPAGVAGRFLVPLRTGRRGEARIDIGISLDQEGVIRAWGVDRSTGARQEGTFAGLWALPPEARHPAVTALARRLDADLARPEFEGMTTLRGGGMLAAALAEQRVDGPGLAAVAGEIDGMRRSTAEPPVRL
jgi:molecular chaperone DnaK (HSP70)